MYSMVLLSDGTVEVLGIIMHIPAGLQSVIQGKVAHIACGYNHALVLLNDGTVAGWQRERNIVQISVIPEKIRAF